MVRDYSGADYGLYSAALPGVKSGLCHSKAFCFAWSTLLQQEPDLIRLQAPKPVHYSVSHSIDRSEPETAAAVGMHPGSTPGAVRLAALNTDNILNHKMLYVMV